MTLITSAITPRYVVQMSDRLVTTTRGDAFDARSNKSVLYLAPNGLAAFSYYGLSYLDGLTTDEWIARRITGIPSTGAASGPEWVGMRFGLIPRWPDIGKAVLDIALGLEDAFSRLPRRARTVAPGVHVVGYQWSRRRPLIWTPVAWTIFRPPGRAYGLSPDVGPRPHEVPKFLSAVPHPPFENEEMEAFAKRLNGGETLDQVESLLAEILEEASHRTDRIGQEAISIALSPSEGFRIRFIGSPHSASFYDESTVSVSFAPWTITRHLVCPPLLMIGTDEVYLGEIHDRERTVPLRLRREGASEHLDPNAPVFFRGSQPRPMPTGDEGGPWSPVTFREGS